MPSERLINDVYANIDLISSNVPSNMNFIKREVTILGSIPCFVLFISGIADKGIVEEIVIKPLMQKGSKINNQNIIDDLVKKCILASDLTVSDSIPEICYELLNGKCVVLVENIKSAVICNTASEKYRSIQESTTEKSVYGLRESFTENLNLNITMLQRKVKNPNLKVEKYMIGDKFKTEVALTYIDGIIDPLVLTNIKSRLAGLKAPAIITGGILEQFIDNRPYNLFPITKSTERPDKVVFDLLEGKAAIFISESSTALIAPATFFEFFQGFEDYSERTILANFSRLMRFIAILTVMILEPIYLVLLIYNPELFPYKLMSLIISSRQNIPLPPLLEILAMGVAIEILREGGLRLPNPIGTTLAIVGGIVIGESATRAGLVSYVTLFIVAITVICTFIIPSYQMALTIRFIRFPMLILGQMFGFYGLLVGFYFLLVHLTKMESFGIAYFSPIVPSRFTDLLDSFIRAPLKNILIEPKSLHPSRKSPK
ncbi:Spore germination protein A1 [Caloramator mitchellensis]|uniref:Spore germination protein A1 n=1 Tax=Caloramator mitchellensis TaxID=908809 RepID=A0A0R3K486_CALMK|nr:spore germination protein [Caloramator mitchellensis]KRQ87909.1 Spore germination protein A1 [Caloramator mitchellensis]